MSKTINLLKGPLIDELLTQLSKKGFTTCKEAEAYDRYHDLDRIVVYCKYGTPRALIEISPPGKDGVVRKSLANTMIQAVPLHTVSNKQEITQLVSSLK